MLRKFTVSNFKSFEKDFEFDLSAVNGYKFNKQAIKNGIVNNALIYGHNGSGKSNLALAIFDIIAHLTDNHRHEDLYLNYLNADSKSKEAKFKYEFLINSKIVLYEYHKLDYKRITFEKLTIDNKEIVIFDRNKTNIASVNLMGAENLNTKIENPELSIIKYIKNNTALIENDINSTFHQFIQWVDRMLYFRSLSDRRYIGTSTISNSPILEDIINNNSVQDFEFFLNAAGIECKLSIVHGLETKTIAFDFNNKQIPFNQAASTGTLALTLFYYWLHKIKQKKDVSFVFIDEFDAFYHHSLAALIVEKLKETGLQFILTTHNTSIISNDILRPDCYFVMSKDKISSLSKTASKELREAHNIEKMYKAGSFNVE